MRTHRCFGALQPWAGRNESLAALMKLEHLAVARLEPVTRGREPSAFLDLYFTDGEGAVTVPLVYVDLAQLDVREFDPLVFPRQIQDAVGDGAIAPIVERIVADLERRALGGGFREELVFRYASDALFDRARAAGFFGAAPLAVSLPRIAGCVYAQRFAMNKHVIAYGPGAAEAAAFVRVFSRSCAGPGEADDAAAWYGATLEPASGSTFDLAIGRGAAPQATVVIDLDEHAANGTARHAVVPRPADLMLSFSPDDGPPASRFGVRVTREPFAREDAPFEVPLIAGGSAGRIAIAVRADALALADSDSDEARTLARVLEREGFTVAIVTDVDALDAFMPDLVHLFGVLPGTRARAVSKWAGDHRKPLVVHAYYEAPAQAGYWGVVAAPYCFGYSADDRNVTAYLDMLGRRAVEIDGVGANAPYAPPLAALPDAEAVLASADLVLVHSERERIAVDALRGRRPTVLIPPLPTVVADPANVGALTGLDPFILVHEPIGPVGNQLLLARAAGELGVAMLITGPTADPAYAELLREFAPAGVNVAPEPSAAEVAGLYRTASVVASAAWISSGHGRLASAAAMGAAVVCSHHQWLRLPENGFWTVDPADVRSIARGLGSAWDCAYRGDPVVRSTAESARKRVQSAPSAVVTAYAKIVQGV